MEFIASAFQVIKEIIDTVYTFSSLEEAAFFPGGEFSVGLTDIYPYLVRISNKLSFPPSVSRLIPGIYGTLCHGKVFIRNNKVFVIIEDIAEPLALRACADRVVKGEKQWVWRGDFYSAFITAVFTRKSMYSEYAFFTIKKSNAYFMVAFFPRCFY